jgi:hypothetical protein
MEAARGLQGDDYESREGRSMTTLGRLTKLVAWLRSGSQTLLADHDMRDAADDIEGLIRSHERLTDIARAARRLDKAIAEFGPDQAYVGDMVRALHHLLRDSPGAGELVIEELPSPQKGSA